jgi:hypothetical protein
MATAESVKAKIQSLIKASNAKTGKSDKDLTSATRTLINGYGQGGGGGSGIIDVTELPTTGLADGTVYRLTEDSADIFAFVNDADVSATIGLADVLGANGGFVANVDVDIVDQIPDDAEEVDIPFNVPIYVIRTTGVPYLNIGGRGVIKVGEFLQELFDGTFPDFGWQTDTPNDIAAGIYCVRKSKISFFVVENGLLKEFNFLTSAVKYDLSDDGTHYIASRDPNSKDTLVDILGVYNGLPVKVSPMSFINSSIRCVRIGEGIESIGFGWFSANRALGSVFLPNTLTEIGDSAFNDCGLLSVTIPDNVKVIRYAAFSYCTALRDVQIPSSLKSIEQSAFADCVVLSNFVIPDGVTDIGDWAFQGCLSLNNTITIPDSCENVGGGAFAFCRSIPNAHWSRNIAKISDGVFSFCSSLASIGIPVGVTAVGAHAFEGCTSLNSINLPDGLEKIKGWAFSDCWSLRYLKIPSSVNSIEGMAFNACGAETVIFKGTPSLIATSAFQYCNKLTDIYVPWSEGEVANAPWGATNATIHYNYTE